MEQGWGKGGEPLAQNEKTGQIIRLYADVATVQIGENAFEAPIRGKLFRADPPAVGDFVRIEPVRDGYAIAAVLPRRSALARRAAGNVGRKQVLIANIDQVVVVFSAAQPLFNAAMLDRFLVVVEANDLEARIVVNKMDLAPSISDFEKQDVIRNQLQPYVDAGYPVHFTSVETGLGIDALREALEGQESAFVGPSGVGKSSLLNTLYPGLDLKVGRVSEAYGKGRHTTVGGYLIRLSGGASVADTAGLREVGLWLIPPDELPDCFPEFRPQLGECRFSDCAHLAEPDCAITAALEAGEIAPSRYESYVKLRAEATETWPRW
jgi:ribosome biogenesis GTPase